MAYNLTEQEIPLSTLRRQFQGPSWIKDYIIVMHNYYLEEKATFPATLTAEDLASFGHDPKKSSVLVTIDLTPLVIFLHTGKWDFYPSEKQKAAIHEGYMALLHTSYEAEMCSFVEKTIIFKDSPRDDPQLKLTTELSPGPSKDPRLALNFCFKDNKWYRVLEDDEDDEDDRKEDIQALDELKAYEHGDVKWFSVMQRYALGERFREGKNGMRIQNWMANIEIDASPDLAPVEEEVPSSRGSHDHGPHLQPSTPRQVTDVEIKAQPIPFKLRFRKVVIGTNQLPLITANEVTPQDSSSRRRHNNFKAICDEQGWDDTPDEELGWVVIPEEQTPGVQVFDEEPAVGMLTKKLRDL